MRDVDLPALQGYPSNDSISATSCPDPDSPNEGHDSLTSSSSTSGSQIPELPLRVNATTDAKNGERVAGSTDNIHNNNVNYIQNELRRVTKNFDKRTPTRHTFPRRVGLKCNKFWLTSCGIRCRFSGIRTVSVGELFFWTLCCAILGYCTFLVGRSFVYGQSSMSFVCGFCIHSGSLTGVFYFLTILLSSRYPFYWKLGLFVIGFDRQITYHRKCAILGAICCALHVLDHWKSLHLFSWEALTGWICYGSALFLLIFSISYFRRKFYNGIFIRSHWIFIVIFLVFGWLHHAIFIQIGTGFIVLDAVIRVLDQRFRSTKITNIRLLDFDRVLKLEFQKKHFRYRAGQYVFLRVPAVGLLEFHPFSISSYPGSGDTFSLHIKSSVASANGWTSRLMKYMKEHENKPEHYKDISVQIEGPFGELTLRKELSRYEHVVFISGGIGITPLDSLYNQLVTDLLDNNIRRTAKTRKIDFIFTTRSRSLITEFASRNTAWEFQRRSSVREGHVKDRVHSNHLNVTQSPPELHGDHLTIEVSPPDLPGKVASVETSTGASGCSDRPGHRSMQTSISWKDDIPDVVDTLTVQDAVETLTVQQVVDALTIPSEPRRDGHSLDLEDLDKIVGSGKPKIIRFSSTRSSTVLEDLAETYAEDLAVDSLQITNSTHITRIKDEALKREYKETYPFINFKRPNIREIIYHAAAATHSKDICVLTSGPKGMINECKRWAVEIGVDVHSEIFDW